MGKTLAVEIEVVAIVAITAIAIVALTSLVALVMYFTNKRVVAGLNIKTEKRALEANIEVNEEDNDKQKN